LCIRRNRGKQIAGNWVHALEEACGIQPSAQDFLGLRETEDLKKAFFQRVREVASGTTVPSLHQYWALGQLADLTMCLRQLAGTVNGMRARLFSSADKYIGAVRVPADRILLHPFETWRVVEEDLALVTDDLLSGLCLELNYYDTHGLYVVEGIYELTAWEALQPRPPD
jgi:hypothetical protein